MRFTLILAAIIGGIALWSHSNAWSILFGQTNLGWFESRIAGISDELLRRSPRLRVNFARFEVCMESGECNSSPILAERDRILRSEWLRIFPRYLIKEDWGSYENSVEAREIFFEAVRQHGEEKLRRECLPILEYRWRALGSGFRGTHGVYGFDCGS